MDQEPKVVAMPGAKAPPQPKTDADHAKESRAAYRKLCKLIDEASQAGLRVTAKLDSTDIVQGLRVREREIEIIRRI